MPRPAAWSSWQASVAAAPACSPSILGQAGFHVPQPEVDADSTNPKGFGEPKWVVDFHGRQLRSRRVSVWDSRPSAWQETSQAVDDPAALAELRGWLKVQFVGRDSVVVKDPRIGWFLPLWEKAAEDIGVEVSFATLLRHPAEAVSSAIKWYGDWQTPASRTVSWLNIMLETEYATRGREADLRPVRRPAHRLVRPGGPDRATRSPSRRCRTSTPTSGPPSTRSSTRPCTARR